MNNYKPEYVGHIAYKDFPSDKELLAQKDYMKLYTKYYPLVMRYKNKAFTEEVAEEFISESYIIFLKAIKSWEARPRGDYFMYNHLRGYYADLMIRMNVKYEKRYISDYSDINEEITIDDNDSIAKVEKKIIIENIRQLAKEEIQQEHRRILNLLLDGCTISEITERTELPRNTVSLIRSNIMKKLQRNYKIKELYAML